jgi:hypothetical protein
LRDKETEKGIEKNVSFNNSKAAQENNIHPNQKS